MIKLPPPILFPWRILHSIPCSFHHTTPFYNKSKCSRSPFLQATNLHIKFTQLLTLTPNVCLENECYPFNFLNLLPPRLRFTSSHSSSFYLPAPSFLCLLLSCIPYRLLSFLSSKVSIEGYPKAKNILILLKQLRLESAIPLSVFLVHVFLFSIHNKLYSVLHK